MVYTVISEEVDLFQLPLVDEKYSGKENTEITIGDLHGNSMKLLFLLVKHGIANNLSKKDYGDLVALYKKDHKALTSKDLTKFNSLLDKITFKTNTKVRLIGDELADRGSNDYFTLKLLEKMSNNQVPFEILLSNHSIEFINNREKDQVFKSEGRLDYAQAKSMYHLQTLIEKKRISKKQVFTIYDNVYTPNLKLLSYTLSNDNKAISIHSHAPIGLETIRKLVEVLNLKLETSKLIYDDSSAIALAKTIETINTRFNHYAKNNQITTLFDVTNIGRTPLVKDQSAFDTLTWNRDNYYLECPEKINDYSLYFIYGHDSGYNYRKNVTKLDNNLGKFEKKSDNHSGNYTAVYSDKITNGLTHTNSVKNPTLSSHSVIKNNRKKTISLSDSSDDYHQVYMVDGQNLLNTISNEADDFMSQQDEDNHSLDSIDENDPSNTIESQNSLTNKFDLSTEYNLETQSLEIINGEESFYIVNNQSLSGGPTDTSQSDLNSKFNNEDIIAIEQIKLQITIINQKSSDLDRLEHHKAAQAAFVLAYSLRRAVFDLSQGIIENAKFKKICKNAIHNAREELENHRGWKRVFIDLLMAISTLGVALMIVEGVNIAHRKITGKYAFFRTDSAKKLDVVENIIDAISISA